MVEVGICGWRVGGAESIETNNDELNERHDRVLTPVRTPLPRTLDELPRIDAGITRLNPTSTLPNQKCNFKLNKFHYMQLSE